MNEGSPSSAHDPDDAVALVEAIRAEALALGFSAAGVTHTRLTEDEALLEAWLAREYHGDMGWMARHGTKRSRPEALVPGTLSVICVALDYLPAEAQAMDAVLADGSLAYVSRYALGRDYHKVVRGRLRTLARWLERQVGALGYRVFSDSAPVLEKALARNAGLGFIALPISFTANAVPGFFWVRSIPISDSPPMRQIPVTPVAHVPRVSRHARRPLSLPLTRWMHVVVSPTSPSKAKLPSRWRCGRCSVTGFTGVTIASSSVHGTGKPL